MLKTYTPALDLQRFFPFLEKNTALLLHPRRARVPDPFASKMRGQIAWPQNEPWPRCPEHDKPLISVLQLRRSDAPQLVFADGNDLFQLLWCPTHHEGECGYGPLAKTFWRNSKTVHSVLKRAPHGFMDEGEGCIPHECELHFEQVQEYPSSFELQMSLSEKQLNDIDAFVAQHGQEDLNAVDGGMDEGYHCLFDPSPGSKIGGHVSWIQDPESASCAKCRADMRHLLTISSLEVGDPGTRWKAIVDENGTSVNTDSEMREQLETGLCIGDMGSVYVMECRRCEHRPIRTIFQCS